MIPLAVKLGLLALAPFVKPLLEHESAPSPVASPLACAPGIEGALLAFPDPAALALVSGFVPTGNTPCDQVAATALTAGQTEARADYLFEVAKCINSGGTFASCIESLRATYVDALALAQQQFMARTRVCQLLNGQTWDPDIDPEDFTSSVTHSLFPLLPGRTLVYRKVTPAGVEVVTVTTDAATFEIDGVDCAIVRDSVRLNGELIEDTDDWYAQDDDGNVWYFGEIARNYEDGVLHDVDGSWKSGEEGAVPGIVMLAAPSAGDAYRQELLLGDAEDYAVVMSTKAKVTVPYGTFTGCLQTEDASPLEPGKWETKFYAPGIGFVLAINDRGERTELVEVIDP